MHISCIICSDPFNPNSAIHTTQCGHIFHHHCLLHWLENSKTCPQCRNKVALKSLVRLYVNVMEAEDSDEDVTILQHKLDSAEYSIKLKDTQIKNATTKISDLEDQNKALRNHVKKLELSEKRYESVVAACKDQIKFFKGLSKNHDQMEQEVLKLKKDLKDLEHVSVALNGTRQQVDDIVRNENNIESLALLVAILKKSLVENNQKKLELEHALKKAKNEIQLSKRKDSEQQSQLKTTRLELETLKKTYEKEINYLKEKYKELKNKAAEQPTSNSFNNSILRITSESPVNYNRTPIIANSNGDNLVVDLTDTPPAGKSALKIDVGLKLKGDDQLLPPSSMGLFGIERAKRRGNNTDKKNSIFKAKSAESDVPTKNKSNVTYDGLGGSSKDDVFPSASVKRPRRTNTSSSKFKKLSAAAGKSNGKKS